VAVLDSIHCDGLRNIAAARAAARAEAWMAGAAPDEIVIDVDGTLLDAHSDKQDATQTYKRGFGFYPVLAYLDATGEALAGLLRPGRAGSNNAADHVVRHCDRCRSPVTSDPRAADGPLSVAHISELARAIDVDDAEIPASWTTRCSTSSSGRSFLKPRTVPPATRTDRHISGASDPASPPVRRNPPEHRSTPRRPLDPRPSRQDLAAAEGRSRQRDSGRPVSTTTICAPPHNRCARSRSTMTTAGDIACGPGVAAFWIVGFGPDSISESVE
jgi:hypothetical protein